MFNQAVLFFFETAKHFFYGTKKADAASIAEVKTAKIDGAKLKTDTWYTLKNGEFEETE